MTSRRAKSAEAAPEAAPEAAVDITGPLKEQGREAKRLGLPAWVCPYDGDLEAAWLAGYNGEG